MISGSLTRRYVQPLFEVAREQGILDQVGEEIAVIDRALRDHPELKSYLHNPTVERQTKREFAVKVFAGANQYTINFLKVVLDKKRPEILGEALRAYTALLNVHRGITPGLIETAVPVDETMLRKIEGDLAKRFGGKLELESRVNPEIIGGIRVRVGNTVIDGSIKTRLAKMKKALTAT